MGIQENVQAAKQIYIDFMRGDVDGVLNTLAPDVDWGFDTVATEVPWFRIWKGHAGVRELLGHLGKEMEVGILEPDAFVASEDRVVVIWHGEATLKKNGRRIDYPEAVHIWTFGQDGKITRVREFVDTAAVLAAWRG